MLRQSLHRGLWASGLVTKGAVRFDSQRSAVLASRSFEPMRRMRDIDPAATATGRCPTSTRRRLADTRFLRTALHSFWAQRSNPVALLRDRREERCACLSNQGDGTGPSKRLHTWL